MKAAGSLEFDIRIMIRNNISSIRGKILVFQVTEVDKTFHLLQGPHHLCVGMNRAGKWWDLPCASRYYSVCKVRLTDFENSSSTIYHTIH